MVLYDMFSNNTNTTNATFELGAATTSWNQRLEKLAKGNRAISGDISAFIIIPYSIIFLLSVVGNSLVIMTLIRHEKMRTVTNVFLLNLAISDLLLAVFCMPFSLVPMFMQEFIFGPVVCVLLRYAQGMMLLLLLPFCCMVVYIVFVTVGTVADFVAAVEDAIAVVGVVAVA